MRREALVVGQASLVRRSGRDAHRRELLKLDLSLSPPQLAAGAAAVPESIDSRAVRVLLE